MSTPKILEERQSQWGDPVTTHARIALAWSAILDHEVTATEVALCMAAMKLVRTSINKDEPDSYDDAKGYVDIAGMIAQPDGMYLRMLNVLRSKAPGKKVDW